MAKAKESKELALEGFLDFLKIYHRGKSKSIPSSKMREWGCDAEIRNMVHDLRVNGHPICSSLKGYYYGVTADEINETIEFLGSYIRNIRQAQIALKVTKFETYGHY